MDSSVRDRLRSLAARSAKAPSAPTSAGIPRPSKGKETAQGPVTKSLQVAPLAEKGKSPLTEYTSSTRKRSRSESELSAPTGKIPDDLAAFMKKAMTYLKPELREAKAKADIEALSNTCLTESMNVSSFLLTPYSSS